MRTADLETIHGLIDWFSLHSPGTELEPVSLAGLDPWFRVTIVSDAHPKYSWCAHAFGGVRYDRGVLTIDYADPFALLIPNPVKIELIYNPGGTRTGNTWQFRPLN